MKASPIGSSSGAGLFNGSGNLIVTTGPIVIFCLLVAGLLTTMVLRMLGEKAMNTPITGLRWVRPSGTRAAWNLQAWLRAFGTLKWMTDHPSRFRSATTYTGRALGHVYRITVCHAPWRTKVTALTIDGAEQIAPGSDSPSTRSADPGAVDAADSETDDATRTEVRVHDWFAVRITVRRPGDDGPVVEHEVIHVTTAALGGAGEVEVRSDADTVPLLAEPGSRSEARDLTRAARPNTFALLAGLTTALRLVVPLLGLGVLLSFITEPLKAWLSQHLSPVLDPVFAWLGRLLEPVGRFLMSIGEFIGRVIDFLFGWLPSPHLPFDIPDWVWTTARIALLAFLAFSISQSNLKRRRKRLEKARAGSDEKDESSDQ